MLTKLMPIWTKSEQDLQNFMSPTYDDFIMEIIKLHVQAKKAGTSTVSCYPYTKWMTINFPPYGVKFRIDHVSDPMVFLNSRFLNIFSYDGSSNLSSKNLFWDAPYIASAETKKQVVYLLAETVSEKNFKLTYIEPSDTFVLDNSVHYSYTDTCNYILENLKNTQPKQNNKNLFTF